MLDSTASDTAPNPGNPALPLRRSTRLDFPGFAGTTGYGPSDNAILAVFGAASVKIRGLSFLARRTPGSDNDPAIYAVALARGAANARVQGCWFGLAPGGTTQADVKPPASAVAAFRWRVGGDVYSAGAVIGTDGDGMNDQAEFNVIVGGRVALALELPGARVAGNYVNVFPDGLHFLDPDANFQLWRAAFTAGGTDPGGVTIENFENGRLTDDTIIGTNGDGVGDADERNVFGHVVYDNLLEFYSNARRAVIAGNYFGVGIDGVTPAPLSTNVSPNFAELPGTASVRVGSNGDGVSDALEENVVANLRGSRCVVTGSTVPIVTRRNRMTANHFSAVPFGPTENGGYPAYYNSVLADVSQGVAPIIVGFTDNVLSGTFPAGSGTYPNHIIDVYLVDNVALANETFWPDAVVHPGRWLASYVDNGPGDLNPAPNEFSFDLTSFSLSVTTYVAVAVSYSQDAGSFNAGRAVTSPMSNPASLRPRLQFRLLPADQTELMWFAPRESFLLQAQFDKLRPPDDWFEYFGETYSNGRNILKLQFELGYVARFYSLISR